MNNAIIYLHNIQNEYYHILKSKEQIVFSDDLNLVEITMIIEEIDIFWRKNRDKILFDLDYFDDKETLFLAGSMYLDIDDNCHYYFKTFGDENIINDPILKFQNIANNNVRVYEINLKDDAALVNGIYKNYNLSDQDDRFDMNNPSSGNPTSTLKAF